MIVTPSYNQLAFLKRCVASVADQVDSQGESVDGCSLIVDREPQATQQPNTPATKHAISVLHHIQDACSIDGTVEFFQEYVAQQPTTSNYQLTFASEADQGMYGAINRGVELAIGGIRHQALGVRGKGGGQQATANNETQSQRPRPSTQGLSHNGVVAWLNCDEQYLPGTIEKVSAFFEAHPDVDILFGGMLMVDAAGELLACRKAMPMRKPFLEASYLYNYSCAMFFRESLWCKLGGFDPAFKNAGDEDLIRRALKLKATCCVLNDYLATFTYAESNLSSAPEALEEHERLKGSSSAISSVLKLPINLIRLAEKVIRVGHIQRSPVEYKIYADDMNHRTRFVCNNPSCKWPDASQPYLFKHRLKG